MHWALLAFLLNGISQFLQKYLHASGLGRYQSSALIAMYVAGAVGGALLLAARGRAGRKELAAGAAVGFCSFGGNFAVLRALGSLPAYTVFSIVIGGAIVLVTALSWAFLGERPDRRVKLGLACGIAAVALLTLG